MRDTNLALKASGALTETTTSTAVDFGGGDSTPLTYALIATAVTGTSPTLDVKIQESDDNSTFRDALVFPQMTAAGEQRITAKLDGRYRKIVSTIAGTTPSFNFSVYPELGGRYAKY